MYRDFFGGSSIIYTTAKNNTSVFNEGVDVCVIQFTLYKCIYIILPKKDFCMSYQNNMLDFVFCNFKFI